MKKFLSGIVFVSALALIVAGCSQQENLVDPDGLEVPIAPTFEWTGGGVPCAIPQVVPFYAGQFIDIGTVTASLEDGLICVDIQTTDNWVLVQTHATFGLDLDSLPLTGSGNPQVGHFIFQTEHDPPVTSFSYCTDPLDYLYEPGDVYIAVHAEAILLDDAGNPIQEETAWADGPEFPGRSWATYFILAVDSCSGGGEEEDITITSANWEEEICFDSPLNIYWDSTGDLSRVNITLLNGGGVPCATIAENVENSGWYEWFAQPCDECDESELYTIEVTDLNGAVADTSDIPFRLIPCGNEKR